MGYETQASLDAPTLSGRTQEIEKLNEIQSPENRPGSALASDTYDEYFQHDDFSVFRFQGNFAQAGTGSVDVKIYCSDQDDDAIDAVDYEDVTQHLKIIPDGGAATTDITTTGTWKGVVVDADGVMLGAKSVWIEIVIVTDATGSYRIDKNNRVI